MCASDPRSDAELLRGTRADPKAFGALYRRYENPMLLYFLRRTGDPELAADLTAEVFAAALVSAGRYRPSRGPVAAWLYGIARNKLADSRRRRVVEDRARRKLAMEALPLDDEDLARVEALERHAACDLLQLVKALPLDQRSALWARAVEEKPYDEIGAELRCSPAVVRKRVSRATATLRRRIGEESS